MVQSTAPAALVTVILAPGSVMPVMGEPSVAFSVGAARAVRSLVAVIGAEVLPAGSVAVTVSTTPPSGAGEAAQEYVPSAAATVVHSVVPAGSLTVMVVPGSAMPVTGLPSVGSTVGVTGATVSTTTEKGLEVWPAPSDAVTVSTWPLAGIGVGLQV